MAKINKKSWPEEFEAVLLGKKKFDFRLNDFDIHEGDTLRLEEWDPDKKDYTGRSIEKKVTYVGRCEIDKTFWSKEEILGKGLLIISME